MEISHVQNIGIIAPRQLPYRILLHCPWQCNNILPRRRRVKINSIFLSSCVLLRFRNGRSTEGLASLAQHLAADVNKKSVTHVSVISLFRSPRLRARTLAICFNWFACGLGFFGVSQYLGNVSGNIYANVAISASFQVTIYYNLQD